MNEKKAREYVQMIMNGAQEVLDGTLDLRVFLVSCEMATLEASRLLNETVTNESKKP